jgi:hypothetical protein
MYLRSMKILQDELKNPTVRAQFEANLAPIVDEEIDNYRQEHNKSYLNQKDVDTISNRVASKFSDNILRGKF